ncbi:MAG: hypothetical protein VKI82_08820 [Leptolyngbya sp.]|nr:hypothetical protein [Leptolyngbya sp.]
MIARQEGFLGMMKNRCLPCHLILRNLLILLLATAGVVYYAAEIQAGSHQTNLRAAALRQLFVYQLLSHIEAE